MHVAERAQPENVCGSRVISSPVTVAGATVLLLLQGIKRGRQGSRSSCKRAAFEGYAGKAGSLASTAGSKVKFLQCLALSFTMCDDDDSFTMCDDDDSFMLS